VRIPSSTLELYEKKPKFFLKCEDDKKNHRKPFNMNFIENFSPINQR